jgi:hypothetical protein
MWPSDLGVTLRGEKINYNLVSRLNYIITNVRTKIKSKTEVEFNLPWTFLQYQRAL